jgi:hypothetical protein
VGGIIHQREVSRKASQVGPSLRLEYERARDKAGKKATPRFMVTEETLAAKRSTVIDWNRQGDKPASNQNRAHVRQVCRQKKIENLEQRVYVTQADSTLW